MHVTVCRGALARAGIVCVATWLGGLRLAGQTTAAPVIAPIADLDTTLYNGGQRQSFGSLEVFISNSPTSISATGYPQAAGTTQVAGGRLVFQWDNTVITPGIYNVTVNASNASGATSRSFRWTVHPSMVNFIYPDKPTYTVGDVITLTAPYTRPIVVTGLPYIELWPGKNAVYSSGSGTTDLKFQATVTASDVTHRGLVAARITAGTGTLATVDGASANLLGAASPNRVGSVTPPFDVVVPPPTPLPVISNESFSTSMRWPNRENPAGWTFFILASNSPTSYGLTGLPGAVRSSNAVTLGGSGTGASVAPGIYSVTLSATNAAGTTNKTIEIRVHPSEMLKTVPKQQYAVGEEILITVQMNGFVTVTGSPTISIGGGGTGSFRSGSGTGQLVFSYIPVAADAGKQLTIYSVNLNGGTIRDASTGLEAMMGGPPTANVPGSELSVVILTPPPATTPPPAAARPVVSRASVAGQVGVAIAPVQVAATGAPTSFAAPGLAGYGLSISAAGLITGTPSTAANAIDVPVTATNSAGTSDPANIQLNITAAAVPPPPPVTLPPPAIVPPPVIVPPPATVTPPPSTPPPATTSPPIAQTITFNSPVSAIAVNTAITLGATSSAGLPITYSIVSGDATLAGNVLTPRSTATLIVRASSAGNDAVAAASTEVNFGNPQKAAQAITVSPLPSELLSDRPLTLAATASSGLPVRFEVVSGPATLTGDVLRPTAAAGTVVLRAVQTGTDTFGAAAATHTLTIVPASRMINLSSRVLVRGGDSSRAFIAGFVVSGAAPKRIMVRAVGPALAGFGVESTLANPRLRVFDQSGQVVAESDDWSGAEIAATAARVGAFALASGSRDAALLLTLAPGAYSLHVDAAAGEGVALVELYDASDVPAIETQQVINISTRAFVDTGEGVLTAGFVVTGSVPKRVLIRGIGPSLTAFGVTGALADPVLRLYHGTTVVAQNDDWQAPQPIGSIIAPASAGEVATAAANSGAFSLGSGSKDAALLLTLAPGAYTVTVSGANNTSGAGLVEVYEASADRSR